MSTKSEQYVRLLDEISRLIADEHVEVSVLANVSAALNAGFGWLWTGFYMVDGDWLVLGPFQGSVACWRIRRGRGVCGTAWETGTTQVVPNVDLFPGHIACSSLSRSEIVVPLKDSAGQVRAVLDIDHDRLSAFDSTDRLYLEQLCEQLARQLYR